MDKVYVVLTAEPDSYIVGVYKDKTDANNIADIYAAYVFEQEVLSRG